MTTFLLIRHADTDAVGKSIAGWEPGWHLNVTGQEQASRLSERLSHLPIRAVYTSPLERAVETAEAIAGKLGLPVQTMRELGEVEFGDWEGLTLDELGSRPEWKTFHTFRSGNRSPGGEWMLEVQVRMVRALDSLRRRHTGETVVIVSHGDPLRLVVAYFLGIAIDLLERLEIRPASVSVLEIADWGARVLCLNHGGESPL